MEPFLNFAFSPVINHLRGITDDFQRMNDAENARRARVSNATSGAASGNDPNNPTAPNPESNNAASGDPAAGATNESGPNTASATDGNPNATNDRDQASAQRTAPRRPFNFDGATNSSVSDAVEGTTVSTGSFGSANQNFTGRRSIPVSQKKGNFADNVTSFKDNAADAWVPTMDQGVFHVPHQAVYTREMKLDFTPKQMAEFNKETETGTKLKLSYVDPTKLVDKASDSSSLLSLDRFMEDLYNHLDMLGFGYLFNIENIMTMPNNNLAKSDPPMVFNMCLNQGYSYLKEENIKKYVQWTVHFKEQEEDYRNLALRDLRQSYATVIASLDPQLATEVKNQLCIHHGDESDDRSRIHYNGPLALFVAIDHITFTSQLHMRAIAMQLQKLCPKSYAGENISLYVQHCNTLLQRVPHYNDLNSLYLMDVLEALTTTQNDAFNRDISHWEWTNRYMKVELQLPALLKHAETLYKEYLHTDRWLQTKKRGSGFTAAATDAAAAAPAPATTPQANAAPCTERRGGKKTRAPPAPWRLIPPGPGEPPKKLDENSKVVWWCKECKLWKWTHDTKNHKSCDDLKAERAGKKTSAKSNESAPRSTCFSDGSAELRDA
jgi:hypothetical protein